MNSTVANGIFQRDRVGRCSAGDSGGMIFSRNCSTCGRSRGLAPMHQAENDWHDENVAIVAKNSPPITARPSGAFCSPPSPRPKSHRRHADDHRKCGHQHGPDTDKAGFERGGDGIAVIRQPFACEADHQYAFAVATPMHMIAPVNAGTESVVPV